MKICGRDLIFCFKQEVVNHKMFLQVTKQVTCGRKQGIVRSKDKGYCCFCDNVISSVSGRAIQQEHHLFIVPIHKLLFLFPEASPFISILSLCYLEFIIC